MVIFSFIHFLNSREVTPPFLSRKTISVKKPFYVESKLAIPNDIYSIRKHCINLQISLCLIHRNTAIFVHISTSDPPVFSTSMGSESGSSTGQPSTCVQTKGFSEATISPFPCGLMAAYSGTDFPLRTLLFFTSYFFS